MGIMQYEDRLQDPKSLFRINDHMMLEITDQDFARRFAAGYTVFYRQNTGHSQCIGYSLNYCKPLPSKH